MSRSLALLSLVALLGWASPALAARPAVCLLAFTDARPVKSPASVPYRIKAENAPEPIRAHPHRGPSEVRDVVRRALAAERAVEVVDMAGADLKRLASDPGLGRCSLLVGGAVFTYEGIVAVDLFGGRLYTAIVGFELVALDPHTGRMPFPPVVFAARRQSEVVKADEDYDASDRQVLDEWIDEALKAASASLPERFVRPAALAALRATAGPPR